MRSFGVKVANVAHCVAAAQQKTQNFLYPFTKEIAIANSHYNFEPNAAADYQFRPERAIDGVNSSSWWSNGEEVDRLEKVHWQIYWPHLPPPPVRKLVIRWHGYLTPLSYRVRVSYGGENYQTIAVIADRILIYDRVDEISNELIQYTSTFYYLQIVMDAANMCKDKSTCEANGESVKEYEEALERCSGKENVLYGIREVEVWTSRRVTVAESGAAGPINLASYMLIVVVTLCS